MYSIAKGYELGKIKHTHASHQYELTAALAFELPEMHANIEASHNGID